MLLAVLVTALQVGANPDVNSPLARVIEPWRPVQWGADDEAGASNWVTPEKVVAATQLIEQGQIYGLGRQYDSEMPLAGDLVFSLHIPGAPTGGCVAKRSKGEKKPVALTLAMQLLRRFH